MDNKLNVYEFHSERRRVRLTQDLEPENIMTYAQDQTIYKKGWEGHVMEDAPMDYDNHKDHLPVLFDKYRDPLWIHKKYLMSIT